MKKTLTIKEVKTEKEMLALFPMMKHLSARANKKDYARMLPDMLKGGYRMVAVLEGKKCIGLSGFWIGTKLYSGKYIEPDNVVIHKEYRSKGIGKKLLVWLEREGRKNGCKTIMLDAYLENTAGHKFYEREGYAAKGYHFMKKI